LDEMMLCSSQFFVCGNGGSYSHFLEKLSAIAGNDVAIEMFRQGNAQGSFSYGCWSNDGN